MRKEYTRDELEHELRETSTSIERQVGVLEQELATSGRSAREALDRAVVNKPLWVAGGALAAGLAVGLFFSRSKGDALPDTHRRLVDDYLDALVDDVRYRTTRGERPGDAVRAAVEDRVPLIIHDAGGETGHAPRGFLSSFVDLAMKTATGFAIKIALDAVAARAGLEELIEPDGDGPSESEDVSAVSAAVSESSES